MTEVFGSGVCRLIIILLLCTYPQTVGGWDVKENSGLIFQPLVSSWCFVLHLTWLFKCLLISRNTNKQACRPGGEDKEWRGNGGHSSLRVTGIVLEQAPVTHKQWPQRSGREREREVGDRMRGRKREQNGKEKWISLSSSFAFLSLMFFFPAHFSLCPIFQQLNLCKLQSKIGICYTYCYKNQINICIISA